MKSQEVLAQDFVRGATKGQASHMFIEGNAIYSYGRHFPIAIRLKNGYLINKDKYSSSTSTHQNRVRGAIAEFSGKTPIELNTEQMKKAIEDEVKTIDGFYISKL